jgi:hypothetical protein
VVFEQIPQERSAMAWATPQYSRSEVDRAGRILAGREAGDLDGALAVIGNWRTAHGFPLNTFQMGMRTRCRQPDPSAIVAQRIKRLSSIKAKLERQATMQLSQMQDIGGCRAVLKDVETAKQVRDLCLASHFKHRLAKEDNYIDCPKTSGYRGIHLVYRYVSDRKDTYKGLLIEVQIRSQLQHAWATAVETVGTFLQQSLKASQGSDEWLRFFVLMSSAMAAREGCPPVPGAPGSASELLAELRERANSLDVASRLSAYHSTIPLLDVPQVKGAKYFLIELRPGDHSVSVLAFPERELPQASDKYLEVERNLSGPGAEAVLVSVDSIDALRRAYPNYFLDTRVFITAMNEAIS